MNQELNVELVRLPPSHEGVQGPLPLTHLHHAHLGPSLSPNLPTTPVKKQVKSVRSSDLWRNAADTRGIINF
jgi:hypothetical protein